MTVVFQNERQLGRFLNQFGILKHRLVTFSPFLVVQGLLENADVFACQFVLSCYECTTSQNLIAIVAEAVFYRVLYTPTGSKVQTCVVEIYQWGVCLSHMYIQRVINVWRDTHVVVFEQIVACLAQAVQGNIAQHDDFASRIVGECTHFFEGILPSVLIDGTIDAKLCVVVVVVEVGFQFTPHNRC